MLVVSFAWSGDVCSVVPEVAECSVYCWSDLGGDSVAVEPGVMPEGTGDDCCEA